MSARHVNFGLWYDFRNPPPSELGFEALYRASLDQIVWAETLGFDSVWLTEHHFCEDGYTPSPLVIAAAIGERTERMRIGTNLMLLPLADPVRLAEDSATLSILTGGRFDLGVGLGYRQLEFDYFGRQLTHRPSLMEEGIDIIRQCWSGEPVRIDGKRFRIDSLTVAPAPEQAPRLYMGGMAPPAIARAARLGDGFLSTGGIGHDLYAEALADQGKPRSAGAICAGNWSIVAPDPEAEAARIGEHVLYQTNQYISLGALSARRTKRRSSPTRPAPSKAASMSCATLTAPWPASTPCSPTTRKSSTYTSGRNSPASRWRAAADASSTWPTRCCRESVRRCARTEGTFGQGECADVIRP